MVGLFLEIKKERSAICFFLIFLSLCMGLYAEHVHFSMNFLANSTVENGLLSNSYGKTFFDLHFLFLYLGLIFIPFIYRKHDIQITFERFIVYLLSIVYGYFLPLQIFKIFLLDSTHLFFVFFILLVFGTDTFAYIFGKLLGHKFFKAAFAPQISSSKTIEGFFGALLWPFLLISLAQCFHIFSFSILGVLLLLLTSLAAISGDLLASLIKRKAHKKDSGSFFPGHGGVLDRLDSALISAPLFLIAAKYFVLIQ